MSDELRARLRSLVETAPAGTMIPVSGLAELLEIDPEPMADFTVEDVAEMVGRAPSTVRGWCHDGILRAYRMHGREWRIPPAALEEWRDRQREGAGEDHDRDHGDDDLSSWRRS